MLLTGNKRNFTNSINFILTKTNSKYLIGYFDDAIRILVLMLVIILLKYLKPNI